MDLQSVGYFTSTALSSQRNQPGNKSAIVGPVVEMNLLKCILKRRAKTQSAYIINARGEGWWLHGVVEGARQVYAVDSACMLLGLGTATDEFISDSVLRWHVLARPSTQPTEVRRRSRNFWPELWCRELIWRSGEKMRLSEVSRVKIWL